MLSNARALLLAFVASASLTAAAACDPDNYELLDPTPPDAGAACQWVQYCEDRDTKNLTKCTPEYPYFKNESCMDVWGWPSENHRGGGNFQVSLLVEYELPGCAADVRPQIYGNIECNMYQNKDCTGRNAASDRNKSKKGRWINATDSPYQWDKHWNYTSYRCKGFLS